MATPVPPRPRRNPTVRPPTDVTFDPKDPFNSYRKMLKNGPPSTWPSDRQDKWKKDMELWFTKNYPTEMT